VHIPVSFGKMGGNAHAASLQRLPLVRELMVVVVLLLGLGAAVATYHATVHPLRSTRGIGRQVESPGMPRVSKWIPSTG
jgi:hypothetical protein